MRGVRRLRFGVVSDVHVAAVAGEWSCGDTTLLERALGHFRDVGCDAVMIAGDITDWGLISQLEDVGAAWRRVFPDNKRPDGGHVEKLFVYGDHDIIDDPRRYVEKYGLSEDTFALEKRLVGDIAGAWRRAFDEDYAPIWMKCVKGYRFVGCNTVEYGRDDAFLENHRDVLMGEKPFFYVQHFHPRGTTAAPWVWGQDQGFSTAALSRFPNAIAFSGHSHTPLVDERVLWQGAFTSVGTGSLRYLIPPGGRENSRVCFTQETGRETMPNAFAGMTDGQNGLVVSVYDDRLTIERWDFADKRPLAADWVVPLPFDGSQSAERRMSVAAVPAFAQGAAVSVSCNAQGGADVAFPPVLSPVRALDYEVALEVSDADVIRTERMKRVYSPKCYRHPGCEGPIVTCVFAADELPSQHCYSSGGKIRSVESNRCLRYRFCVRPCNGFGITGPALHTDWLVAGVKTADGIRSAASK